MKSKIIASGIMLIMIISTLMIIVPNQVSATPSATGDTYNAPYIDSNGNWLIGNATVYDGINILVTGNIYINATGSLTITKCTLTMTETSQYEHGIYLAPLAGSPDFFKVTYGKLDTTNNVTGLPWAIVQSTWARNIYISNSTINHYKFLTAGFNDYFDNSTFHASLIYEQSATPFTGMNISHNKFENITDSCTIYLTNANSIITENLFIDITDSYFPDAPAMITTFGGVNAQGDDIRIIKNHLAYSVHWFGIYADYISHITISQNTFDRIDSRTTLQQGFRALGILLNGEGEKQTTGERSSIDNNTIKLIQGTANYFESGGIGTTSMAKHYDIHNNHIWNTIKGPDPCYDSMAIGYGGSYARIFNNYIGNVSGISDDIYGMGIGIIVSGATSTYVNVSYNHINKIENASNGIIFTGCTHSIMDNNTIELVSNQSVGMGAYFITSNCTIIDNKINNLYVNSAGYILTNRAIYIKIINNYVRVMPSELTSWEETGAFCIVGESWVGGASWTGDGSLIANNTIINNYNGLYNEYIIWDTYLTTKGTNLVVIIKENSNIKYINATFTLIMHKNSYIPNINDSNIHIITINQTGENYTTYLNRQTESGWINITFIYNNPYGYPILLLGIFLIMCALIIVIVMIITHDKRKVGKIIP